jgi:hypothetical protein
MGSALLGGLLTSGWATPGGGGRGRAGGRAPPTSWPTSSRGTGGRRPRGRPADGDARRGRAGRQARRGRRSLPGPRGGRGDPGALHRRRHALRRLETALGGQPSVVRAMPNTPALVGPASRRSRGDRTPPRPTWPGPRTSWAVGTVVRLPERLLDPVTGLSGSGPAYFFLVAEALIEAGVQMGLTRDVSRTLVVETMLGSAKLLAETGRGARGAAGHGDLAGRHHGGRHPGPRVPGRALGLHGGGGGGHGTVALAASLSG